MTTTAQRAWVIYSEHDGDRGLVFTILGVALTEEAARAAVEREARKEALATPGCHDLARPARKEDDGYAPGFWVAINECADGAPLRRYMGRLFGFEQTTIAEDR